jgi:hypothetical protein
MLTIWFRSYGLVLTLMCQPLRRCATVDIGGSRPLGSRRQHCHEASRPMSRLSTTARAVTGLVFGPRNSGGRNGDCVNDLVTAIVVINPGFAAGSGEGSSREPTFYICSLFNQTPSISHPGNRVRSCAFQAWLRGFAPPSASVQCRGHDSQPF